MTRYIVPVFSLLLLLSLFSCKKDTPANARAAASQKAASDKSAPEAAAEAPLEPMIEPVKTVREYEGSEKVSVLPADEFQEYLTKHANTPLIDLRSPKEYATARINRAVNIPFQSGDSGKDLNRLQGAKEVAIYCRDGSTSVVAAEYLEKQGVEKIIMLKQGTYGWTTAHKMMIGGKVGQ